MGWIQQYAATECCDLSTVGRRSGRVHEVEIWFGVVDDSAYFISGNGPQADWFRNAIEHPTVWVRFGDEVRAGTARVVDDPTERRTVGELMGEKYPWEGDPSIGLTFEKWCFEVPLLAVSQWRVQERPAQ